MTIKSDALDLSTPIQIPPVLVAFLEERGSVGCAASRDAHLVPRVHVVSGWRVREDGRAIVCLIPEEFAVDLPQPGVGEPFTLTVEQIGPHETYQFRGRLLSVVPLGAADGPTHERCRDRFVQALQRHHAVLGLDEDHLRRAFLTPVVAATFEVSEIFLQTPGPGAGRRVAPPEPR